MEEQLNIVEGVVSSIVFQNEENGYTILRLEAGAGEITAVGCMPGVAPGESLTLRGSWVRHPSYGEQFKTESVERRLPRGVKEVFHYLASGVVKGIGQTTARRMVEEFGEDALDILECEPEKLTVIKGITAKRAEQMSKEFRQQMWMRNLMKFLSDHDLPVRLGTLLLRRWGNTSLDMVRANPYVLINEEWNVDFAMADKLGEQLGVGVDDSMRLEGALLFELSYNLNNGHIFLPRRKLLEATAQMAGVGVEALEECLDSMLQRKRVVQEQVAGETAIYLRKMYVDECNVARHLYLMSRQILPGAKNMTRVLSGIQKAQGITYAPQQAQAVELAAERQVMLLTGGPGTGKTTVLRGVLAMFEHMQLKTALAAPTGRAAKRLADLCEAEATTIHRLLEVYHDPELDKLEFRRNSFNPLEVDAVIVDEASMVDLPLMASLLDAMRSDCRLILVGDPDQLPSVGPGCVLSDLLRSELVPAVRLTEVFRQAAQSAIVQNAHLINRGQMPDLRANDNDFFFLRRTDAESAVDTIVDLCRRRLPEHMGIPVDQIQVLSPTRRRGTGTASLNAALQQALNPPSEGKGEWGIREGEFQRFGSYVFRTGDRVVQTENNYDLMWREAATGRDGVGVFNGDIGVITEISPRGEVVTLDFEGREVECTHTELMGMEPAYAITVHKAQGSEYRAVILAAVDGAPMLLTRGVLYTAVTRAKELFIIVGDENVVARMVANDRQTRRYSGLRARLAQLVQE